MSDSGSRMGVVACREVRSDAAIVAISLPSSCRNFLLQLLHQLVRYVVVLDVADSNPIAHPQYFRTPSDPSCPLQRAVWRIRCPIWERTVRFWESPRRGQRPWLGADSQVPECTRLMADHRAWFARPQGAAYVGARSAVRYCSGNIRTRRLRRVRTDDLRGPVNPALSLTVARSGLPGAAPGGRERRQARRPWGYSKPDVSPAPRRTISGSGWEKSITVVGSVPQSPESITASTTWSSCSAISHPWVMGSSR